MREIKFRAWAIEDEIMYFPNSYKLLNGGKLWGADLILPEDEEQHRCHNVGEGCILMQFTGLKDKNGKEIYEGDIVKRHEKYSNNTERDYFYVVEYGEKNCSCCYGVYGWYFKKIKGTEYDLSGDDIGFSNYEVIGNKFENPELLK